RAGVGGAVRVGVGVGVMAAVLAAAGVGVTAAARAGAGIGAAETACGRAGGPAMALRVPAACKASRPEACGEMQRSTATTARAAVRARFIPWIQPTRVVWANNPRFVNRLGNGILCRLQLVCEEIRSGLPICPPPGVDLINLALGFPGKLDPH